MANPPDSSSLESRWIGRVIDNRYKIVEVLGEGGMGAVFVAEHLRLRKPVAFKTIKAEFAAHSQAEARFQREALATGRIDHPHVASAIDFGPLPEGGFYLVTQMVRGESLGKRLESGPLPWPQVCLLGMQIADALAAAHAIGIIHRDLKPDNILLEERRDGALHCRVVDFGIARVSGDQATIADVAQPLTRMGAVIGTPGYMPPEQGTGQQVDFRADLYALGVIMWEAFTGQMLWQGDTLPELLARQLGRPAPSLRGDVPDAMAIVVERLLALNPAQRPASALEVRDELRRLVYGNEIGVAPAVSGSAVSQPAMSGSAAIQPATSGSAAIQPATSGSAAIQPAMSGSAGIPAARNPGELTHADARSSSSARTGVLATNVPVTPPLRIPPTVLLGVAVAAIVLVLVLVYGAGDTKTPTTGTGPTVEQLVAEAPADYAEDVKMLLTSRHPQARRTAGEAIAGAPSRVLSKFPKYIVDLARFELADCGDKKAILKKLDSANEARALPALKSLASMDDSCELRDDLNRLIARFESDA
jgi:tRNA A-37 threonylcarbamoyl transferase component Bud32